MKKNRILLVFCMFFCLSLVVISVNILSTPKLILKAKVLNDDTLEITCSQMLGYKYKYDAILTGPKCKVEVKDDNGEWHSINDKGYIYLEYQNEIKENAKTSWVVHVPDDYNLDGNNEYRITHEFVVFLRKKEGEYRIINKVIYN